MVGTVDHALRYARKLLRDLGGRADVEATPENRQSGHRWQGSGLAELTGFAEAPLAECPVPIAEFADGALLALQRLGVRPPDDGLTGAQLLTNRAAMAGFARQGDVSAGGSCRLLPCRDGRIAVNLARESDWELVPAWLEADIAPDWPSVSEHLATRKTSTIVARARLLGLAVAGAEPELSGAPGWYQLVHSSTSTGRQVGKGPLRVVDLSALWAGPLCGQLLRWAGADVKKIESTSRPDGAREGSAGFFDFLNEGKQMLAFDFASTEGVRSLVDLIASADIVIETSRPRALRQLGIVAEHMIERNPNLTWIAISGYGRDEPQANWIAYGDDAGVAGGLSAEIQKASGQWMFCGDAIADPLTGMHAALAALASQKAGGGHLISLSLVQIIQHCVWMFREEIQCAEH